MRVHEQVSQLNEPVIASTLRAGLTPSKGPTTSHITLSVFLNLSAQSWGVVGVCDDSIYHNSLLNAHSYLTRCSDGFTGPSKTFMIEVKRRAQSQLRDYISLPNRWYHQVRTPQIKSIFALNDCA